MLWNRVAVAGPLPAEKIVEAPEKVLEAALLRIQTLAMQRQPVILSAQNLRNLGKLRPNLSHLFVVAADSFLVLMEPSFMLGLHLQNEPHRILDVHVTQYTLKSAATRFAGRLRFAIRFGIILARAIRGGSCAILEL